MVRGEAEESVERLVYKKTAQPGGSMNIMRPKGHVVLVCNLKAKWAGIAQSV